MVNEVYIRNARIEDLNEVVKLEDKIWPVGTRAAKDKFEARLKIFPQGFFIASQNNSLIGVSTSERINYNPLNPPTSWESITDNGYIQKTHNKNGDSLYVVSIGALSRSGGGSALLSAQKRLAEELKLKFLVLGARIPGYDSYCRNIKEIGIEEYTKLKRQDSQLLDPELRFYTRNGLVLSKIIPNYMEDDKESRNYGAIVLWKNAKVS